jgi:peptidoglycan/LPS O-acetylase OafA/YrhL
MAREGAQRLQWLDVTRGLASIIVLVQHLLEQQVAAFHDFTREWLNLGQAGVSAFFLVSGFVIPFSLERAGSLKVFWISRFFRLYPLYWASLILVLAIGLGGFEIFGKGFDPRNPLHLGLNVTMIQELLRKPHALAVYWTLGLEMLFYWIVSFLFVMKWNQRSFWAVIGFGTIILVLGVILPWFLGKRLPVGGRFFYILTALFGTLIFRYTQGDATLRQVLGALAYLILIETGLCLTFDRFMHLEPAAFEIGPKAIFFSAFGGYLLFFAVYFNRGIALAKPLLHLGLISYSVYLLHPLIVHLMPMTPWPAVNLVLSIAAIWALATLSYHAIEKPFQKIGKRFAKA